MEKTNMEERAERLNQMLREQEEDFEIVFNEVWKNNRVFQAYSLRSDSVNGAPTVYYDPEWFQRSDVEVIKFLQDVFNEYAINIDVMKYLNRDFILSRIIPKLVSVDNKRELTACGLAYKEFLDMCVLFYIPLEQTDHYTTSINITSSHLNRIGVSLDEAYERAVENLSRNAEISSIGSVLASLGFKTAAEEDCNVPPMLVCTNTNKSFGAAVMLCPSVIQEIQRRYKEDVVILPSSVHECMAVPYRSEQDIPMFLDMVREINASMVEPEELLTDSVYIIRDNKLVLAL